jgi:flagellar hook-length control protein FliK
VRDALEQTIPRLREMLENSGFSLAEAHVGQDASQEGQSDSGESRGGEDIEEIASQELTREITLGLIDDYV